MSDNNAGTESNDRTVFGYQDFWAKSYSQFRQQFENIRDLMLLDQQMVKAADEKATESVEKLICDFARVIMTAACEVIVLCGNGCGAGAVKIARGMYEIQWTAEYLRRNPNEVDDYIQFSKVIMQRKIDWLKENHPVKPASVSPDVLQQIEDHYQQVKGQFTDGRGRERWSWSDKTIRQIATSIGREKEYELPYAVACSIHHLNFEGLMAHFVQHDGESQFQPPPSDRWIKEALVAAYVCLLRVLATLNECMSLGNDAELLKAGIQFTTWGESADTPTATAEPSDPSVHVHNIE